jgi:hypothetical protein
MGTTTLSNYMNPEDEETNVFARQRVGSEICFELTSAVPLAGDRHAAMSFQATKTCPTSLPAMAP